MSDSQTGHQHRTGHVDWLTNEETVVLTLIKLLSTLTVLLAFRINIVPHVLCLPGVIGTKDVLDMLGEIRNSLNKVRCPVTPDVL